MNTKSEDNASESKYDKIINRLSIVLILLIIIVVLMILGPMTAPSSSTNKEDPSIETTNPS